MWTDPSAIAAFNTKEFISPYHYSTGTFRSESAGVVKKFNQVSSADELDQAIRALPRSVAKIAERSPPNSRPHGDIDCIKAVLMKSLPQYYER